MDSFKVTFRPAGIVVDVAADQTFGDAAVRAGLLPRFGCGSGHACGNCKAGVAPGGRFQHGAFNLTALPKSLQERGRVVLLCCASPLSDCTVKLSPLGRGFGGVFLPFNLVEPQGHAPFDRDAPLLVD
jgi:ferredoxin